MNVNMKSQVEIGMRLINLPKMDMLSKTDSFVQVWLKEAGGKPKLIAKTEVVQNDQDPSFTKRARMTFHFEREQDLRFVVQDEDGPNNAEYIGEVTLGIGDIVSSNNGILKTRLLDKNGKVVNGIDKKKPCEIELEAFTLHEDQKYDETAIDKVVMSPEAQFYDNPKMDVTGAPIIPHVHILKTWQQEVEVKVSNDIVSYEEYEAKNEFKLKISCSGLPKMDFFGSSDPYIIVKVQGREIFRTNTIMDNLNPTFEEKTISVFDMTGGKVKDVEFACYDFDKRSADDLIGTFVLKSSDLLDGTIDLKSAKEIKSVFKHKGKDRGTCDITSIFMKRGKRQIVKKEYKMVKKVVTLRQIIGKHPQPTMLDYVRQPGFNIGMVCAIDYTGSNGDPSSSKSLHSLVKQPNQYQKAISGVARILEKYDSDKMIPVYGYGFMGINCAPRGTSHCYPIGKMINEGEEAEGTDGILHYYKETLPKIKLSGPTNFAPVIKKAIDAAGDNSYTILLIITDGVISDFPNTIKAINKASTLPMSIVIVGVGDANFSSMERLDGDEVKISDRDIVQFVSLKEVGGDQHKLAEETLKEIPEQLVGYFMGKGVNPLKKE